MIKIIVLCALIATTTARDGFRIGQQGQRHSLAQSSDSTARFQEVRTRLRGNGQQQQPAFKVARSLGIDNLADESSFKERLTTLKASKAGAQLLTRLAQRMHATAAKGGDVENDGKSAATEFAGLLGALKSSLTIAGEESEAMWTKIQTTCKKAEQSAGRQISQLAGQLKAARGAQMEARRSLGKTRDSLSSTTRTSLVEVTSNPKDPKEAWRKQESGKTETYCPGELCVRTRTTNIKATDDPSDLVECFNPTTTKIIEATKWHPSMLEAKKISLLNRGYHTGVCEGKDDSMVPASPKSKLFDVLSKLSTNLQDSNAQPALAGKMTPPVAAAALSADLKESRAEALVAAREAKMSTLQAQADSAMTDVAATAAQVTSLGKVLNQEQQFKLQVQHTCQQKVTQHQDEKLARKDQLRAVNVAIELVHGNLKALQRYLLGKPPVPPPGLKPGQSVELLNPKAAQLAIKQRKEAAAELETEKLEFASIFGGSATGGVALVKDMTAETMKQSGEDNPIDCEDGLIWCETTMQCIDPEVVSCTTIEVVKGLHHMDTVVQGEKSAIIFHDSEAEGQHELKMKLEEEKLKYEANRAQNTLKHKKDEEQMKKDMQARKVKEEDEKKRYRQETETLNKLQHKCTSAREAFVKAKQKLTVSDTKLIQANDRVDGTDSALRTKSAACEAFANQTATIRASGSEHVNDERSTTYEDVTKLVNAEKVLNQTEVDYTALSSKTDASKAQLDVLGAKLSETTKARQSSQKQHEKNVAAKCETQQCALTKKSFEEYQLEELKMQASFQDASGKLKEMRAAAVAKSSEVSALKTELTQLNFNAKVEEEKSEKSKSKLEQKLSILMEDFKYCQKEKKRLQEEKDVEVEKRATWMRTKEMDEMKATDAQLAADNICDEKDKFKFKRQEELEESALDMSPLPEQVPMIGMACGLYEDCVSCTADTRCGYASVVGEGGLASAVCMRGSNEGPYFYNDTISGELGAWFYQTCPVAKCRDYKDCKQCLEAGCGFCGGRLACFEGGEFGPEGDDKVPASCPKRFMPTWAYKTSTQGTSRCPLRQMKMTAQAEKEDVALLHAKQIYRQLQAVKKLLDSCHEKLSPMSHGPEKILLGQKCKDLGRQYEILQQELLSAVDAMKKASSGGESKTYEMGYKEGLTQAEREAAQHEGFLKGLQEGWDKAQRKPGPAGPRGPAGPTGKDGNLPMNDDEDEKKNQMDTDALKQEIETETENKINKDLNEEKTNSSKVMNATSNVRNAELEEKKAKEDVRQAISSGDEEARKKAEAELAAANQQLNRAENDAKDTVSGMKSEDPVVKSEVDNLENELVVEGQEKQLENSGVEADDGEGNEVIRNERPGEFNELDVVAASDKDICAKDDAICLSASETITPPATFTTSMDANFQIVDQARIQSLKLWNDALKEQIDVSVNPLLSFSLMLIF
jgi:hypothetical protein